MYKILYKNIIIDVIESPVYCMCFPGSDFKIKTDPVTANCIISSNGKETYHLFGRSPILPDKYKSVKMETITREEYNQLQSLIIEGKDLQIDLTEARNAKISEMSKMSETVIHAGTDITLTNGKTYHFSFSDQDQFQIGFLASAAKNAAMMEAMKKPTLETGRDYPWHADGGDCVFYSRDDMIIIGTAMLGYIQYHNSYFHAMRTYINNLTNPMTIVDLKYGDQVPKMYWGEVYVYANS